MAVEILTIGVFGFDEAGFFSALDRAGADTFCDIRQRRGVRGSKYAFVNSRRLQERLAAQGIRYVHWKSLAPTPEVRDAQKAADRKSGVSKTERTRLGSAFIAAYREQCLAPADPAAFLRDLPEDARRVVLFCVEQRPEACHRSLTADWLASAAGSSIVHLMPPG